MADLLKSAAEWLLAQQQKHASRMVLYQRGVDIVELSATIGRTEFEVADSFGVVQRIESRDFLIETADLVLGGWETLPERGDRISETEGTMTYVYEVLAPGNEPPYRFADLYRKSLRVHTKQVDVI